MSTPLASSRNREEAVNTHLALVISKLGVTADAETIHVHGKYRPDVLFQLRGLRVAIEGKFSDHPNAKDVVLQDARNRVESGIAHIAAAVIYPLALRTTPTTGIMGALERATLGFCIVSEAGAAEDWSEGKPHDLMAALRRAQEALARDDIVEQTAKNLNLRLQGIAELWMGDESRCDRLSDLLGIAIPKGEKKETASARRETSAKVSALVLANALIFQEQLAAADRQITPLRRLDDERDLPGAVRKHWRWIWQTINYIAIFQLVV